MKNKHHAQMGSVFAKTSALARSKSAKAGDRNSISLSQGSIPGISSSSAPSTARISPTSSSGTDKPSSNMHLEREPLSPPTPIIEPKISPKTVTNLPPPPPPLPTNNINQYQDADDLNDNVDLIGEEDEKPHALGEMLERIDNDLLPEYSTIPRIDSNTDLDIHPSHPAPPAPPRPPPPSTLPTTHEAPVEDDEDEDGLLVGEADEALTTQAIKIKSLKITGGFAPHLHVPASAGLDAKEKNKEFFRRIKEVSK
jgi:hypothetical protein